MNELKPWVLTSDAVKLTTPVFQVLERRCLSPKDGKEKTFSCLQAPQWVNVIPLRSDNKIVFVRQFRHGSSEFSLELPGGVAEPGQTILETAKRELMEETGHSAANYEKLCSFRPNPALFDNHIHTFLAYPAEKTGSTQFDENEDLSEILIEVERLQELILDGAIDHALMGAALGFFLLKYPDPRQILARRSV
ncbi:MAG: NUDIX hydrolase [Deltaproteobacteria bacterium]|jgi:8-oxo-dGTP pyrophosphatase MutT (NUDIX family)|nr:NUDIX hydrolase [Deltaproteobacteria bacterium]